MAEDAPRAPWRPWTVPNLISVLRLACLPWFLWLLFGSEPPDRWGAALLLGVLGATDWVDGFIARRFNQVSELGKVLDPTADRLLLIVGVGAIIVDGSMPVVVAVLLLARELAVGIAALVIAALGGRKLDVTFIGKAGTLLMMFAVPMFLAGSSDISAAAAFQAGAWTFAVIGLPIHYLSALLYVPKAAREVREVRGS